MSRRILPLSLVVASGWWAALLVAALAVRPIAPVDETRYLAVAWEMWVSGSYVVPHLNGALYSHKPPLMFWLISGGWGLFGINDWWPRLLLGLFSLGSLGFTVHIARRLWPQRDAIAAIAVSVTAGALWWAFFTGAVMFDLMLAFFVLVAVAGVMRAAAGKALSGWLIAGTGIGLGILTKGPVALLHVLPLALLAPWWAAAPPAGGWRGWYPGMLGAVLLGAAIALAWAIPAAVLGGPQFEYELFWHQSANRMVSAFHHVRPVWWYLAIAPLILFPWLLWPTLWRGLAGLARGPRDDGLRFALAWLVPVFVAFSLISSKQMHYLFPVFPAFAMIVALGLARLPGPPGRAGMVAVALAFAALSAVLFTQADNPRLAALVRPDEQWMVWVTAAVAALAAAMLAFVHPRSHVRATLLLGTATVALMVGAYFGVLRAIADGYDLRPVSAHLAQAQSAGRPIAHHGKYHGQFQFVGRLREPLVVVHEPDKLRVWAGQHPEGLIVVYSRRSLTHPTARPEFVQLYRGRRVSVWRGADFAQVSDEWAQLDSGPPDTESDS